MNREKPKTFHVKSFGCQMNVYDGERMAEMLSAEGMMAAEESMDADIVVLNTCHIREKAAEKVYSDIGRLKREDGTRPMIAVAGRSEEHTSELQSLMRISYAVFCLKKKKKTTNQTHYAQH